MLGQLFLFGALAEFFDFGPAAFAFAQFVLDRLHLLAQKVLALLLVDVRFDARADLLGKLEHLDFLVQVVHHQFGSLKQARGFQQFLLVLDADLEVRGDKVDEERRALDVLDRVGRLARQVRREVHDLHSELLNRADARLQLDLAVVVVLDERRDVGPEVRLGLRELVDLETPLPLNHNRLRAIGHLDQLQDGGDGAVLVQVGRLGFFDVRALLRHHADQAIRRKGLLDQFQRGIAPDRDREHDAGEEHRVAEGQDREAIRDVRRAHLFFFVGGREGDALLWILIEHPEGKVIYHHSRSGRFNIRGRLDKQPGRAVAVL